MERIFLFSSIFLLALMMSRQSDAQFFKKLGDKIEKSVEKRLDRRADQAVDKTLDKAENGTEKAVNDAVASSEKKAKENKVDANEEKARRQAGWPVALPSQNNDGSTPLPENYQLAVTGSGPDLYLEYSMKMEGKKSSEYQMDMRIKMVASPSTGMGRSEMVMKIPVVGEMRMVTLTNAKDPLHIVLLNERKKQYSIIDFSSMEDGGHMEAYTVKMLGEENIHGLHCIHSVATNQDGQSFELWTTTEIPGYEKMVELYSKTRQTGSGDLWKKLQEAGAAGFMVKLKTSVKEGSSVMELTAIKNLNAPADLFNVPSGYKEKKGSWVKKYMEKMEN